MKKEIPLTYGKITFGTLAKLESAKYWNEPNHFPKSPSEWHTFTKNVILSINRFNGYDVFCLNQVHGDAIEKVDGFSNGSDSFEPKEGDGLWSVHKNKILVVRTADCVPVFLYSTKRPFVSILHSGWKGTMLGITEKMIKELLNKGFQLDELVLELGPYIQKQNYEVGEDVANIFEELGKEVCLPKGKGKFLLDVGIAIEKRVKRMFGDNIQIVNEQIEVFQSPQFFSHRAKEEGRNLNFILWES
ncbi:YfiH family protein [Leptospira yanagawae serovar Saopaulo str. Sao Paulo = ATCC 700523]|uniref:YfiH family protein n=1 Tax=Leptospira yanagawae serovar Saopaulo str. Sao Paulo = ATCC 700523 TaxID=1249483 RepID=A0A5E8H9V1_9LEPT|nr:polyphenol oxidase family protein [Leptospira yanagawae]EOQ87632.1 YfiH family protein [Leptospira yanagawae serovar Saopaulo str. Sao Paulo = ATCC 700523]